MENDTLSHRYLIHYKRMSKLLVCQLLESQKQEAELKAKEADAAQSAAEPSGEPEPLDASARLHGGFSRGGDNIHGGIDGSTARVAAECAPPRREKPDIKAELERIHGRGAEGGPPREPGAQ